ncbi:HD domain-containing protein [Patescibacteria group bacterium]|nr:HD domain-containing protein [Patescibacteria group bacterium]MBU1016144.1 HD domain-containing protein [Patescibacteria group bacterium]MBU1684698.1 HD domain-containing protein [Patescibacteria group bacterium]MBU1938355.1 HD domain-containing protein [Patescibacteria group bacterium]
MKIPEAFSTKFAEVKDYKDAEARFRHALAVFPEGERADILKALDFARLKHEGQVRDEGTPYLSHCTSAALNAIDIDCNYEEIMAMLLHDVLEDTDTNEKELEAKFGSQVAFMVAGLTKQRGGKKMPKDEYYDKLKADGQLAKLKACDRLSNIFSLYFCPDPAKQKRYLRDTREEIIPIVEIHHPELAAKLKAAIDFIQSKIES